MTELEEIFAELGISHYLQEFIEQGFDTWETILDIKESDFDALNVKLGHRRKLQRRIANSRGLSSDRALESPGFTPVDDRQLDDQRNTITKVDVKDNGTGTQGAKRKYRRHPKADENAPERPPSAYVIFSNKMREDLKGRNLSFTEIAKLVGEHWQNLAPQEKEPYEQQAFTFKDRYSNELTEYKKTAEYREYQQYLAEFKARQANQQPVADLETSKRPKLQANVSTNSTGTASSGASQQGIDTPTSNRAESSPNRHPGLGNDAHSPPIPSTLARPGFPIGAPKSHSPPVTGPSSILPGYRESLYGSSHQQLPWRDGPREDGAASLQQFSQKASVADRRPSYPGSILSDPRNLTGSAQHAHRTGQFRPSPPLSSESTTMSGGSSASTGSSVFLTPRTPMEPPLDRGMPLPSMYNQKSINSYDNQLPPLRPPSLSPQVSMLTSQQSPTAINSIMDFPPMIAPIRGGGPQHIPPQGDARKREYFVTTQAEEALDPVSALLKAGEIVDRNSKSH